MVASGGQVCVVCVMWGVDSDASGGGDDCDGVWF